MRVYRWLLRLYPASFRAEYGDEMCAVFAARRLEENAWVLWSTAIADVAVNAARIHADVLWQDLQWTLRVLRKSPGFTFTAITVAALGMGATTAAFTLLDHALLRPLPFPDPEKLVLISQTKADGTSEAVSPPNFEDWRAMSTSFSAVGAHIGIQVPMNLVGHGEPLRPDVTIATSGVFAALGIAPAVGRGFTPQDDHDDAPRVALLGNHLANAMFGSGAAAIGRTIRLDNRPYDIVGVMPAGFAYPSPETDLWIPRVAWGDDRRNHMLAVVARLRPDVPIDRARTEMELIAAQLERAYPKENAGMGVMLGRIRDRVSSQARVVVLAVFGAAFCLMLIACTNLANLLFARAMARRQEVAVRIAIGAARERLARQLLTESVVLAIAGGALGLLLAMLATPSLAALVPTGLPMSATPDIDWRVFVFAAVLICATTIAFGAGPAVYASRRADLTLRSRSAAGVRGSRLRPALVLAEVAGTVVLLVAAGLLLKAMWRVQAVDPGFRAEGVLTLRTALPMQMPADARRDFYTRVLGEVRSLPGVTSAAYISFVPMTFGSGNFPVTIPGAGPDDAVDSNTRFITPDYFSSLGIPLRRGRAFSERDDRATAPRVAVISQSLAQRFWPGQDGVGRQVIFSGVSWEVVGIVGDVAVRGLEQPGIPQAYFPSDQVPPGLEFYAPKDLVIRAARNPTTALVPSVRRIIHDINPEQAISDVGLLEDIVTSQTASRRVQLGVLAAFAGVAVLLAAVGIHGLLSFAVSMRVHEVGVRMALGAGPRMVLTIFLRQGVVLGLLGVVAALPLAYAAGRGMTSLLFGVHPADPAIYAAAAMLALVMTLVGSLRPALRAASVDPVITMRGE